MDGLQEDLEGRSIGFRCSLVQELRVRARKALGMISRVVPGWFQ